MKKSSFSLLVLVFFLFIIPFASAEFLEAINISIHESTIVAGKTILLDKVNQEGQVVVKVDGVGKIVSSFGETETINGAKITLGDIVYVNEESASASLTILIKDECGNGICDPSENTDICCTDCGCLEDKTCFQNQCITPKEDECLIDIDCDDNNKLTLDFCEKTELQNVCRYTEIEEQFECFTDKECNDNDPCTTDSCSLVENNKCIFEPKTICSSNDGCCPSNCNFLSDSDCKETCTTDGDCNDKNPCTKNSCANGICVADVMQGCAFDGKCLPIYTRKRIESIPSFCKENIFFAQKNEGAQCNEEFECKSNKCINKECASSGFFGSIINFIKNIFLFN